MNPQTAEKLDLAPYDSADYLHDEGDITTYLQAVMAEDSEDPAYLARALGVFARARNMSQIARDTGLTREVVRKALAPGGNPSYATVAKVVKALGFRLTLALVGDALGKTQDLTPKYRTLIGFVGSVKDVKGKNQGLTPTTAEKL